MSYHIERVPDCYALLGEGPHWDIERQSLYLVDIFGKKFLRYDYAQDKVYRCEIENEPMSAKFIIPIEGTTDKFISAIDRRIVVITWDGISETCKIEKDIFLVEQQDTKYENNQLNDGKCDLRGRLFTGTMNSDFLKLRTGNLYRLDKNGPKLLQDNIGLSNGLAWNKTASKFYYVDSMDFKVKEFDYDINSGEIKNPRVVFSISSPRKDGKMFHPDGMTVDSDGFIYVAVFGGSSVFKIDPMNCNILLEIKIPCEQITSVAFGGPNLDILYVTTGALDDEPAPAGETFRVTGLGAKGLPMIKFKLLK